MNSLEITKKYFQVSNKSDFSEIEKLLHTNCTYSSQNTGLYLWSQNILKMQKEFHWSFEKLVWNTREIVEEKEGIVRVAFDFLWTKNGEKISFSGIEYVIVCDGKIQHIEIKGKK